jgi:L-aminopeptidase/D-esterase-like protein
MRKVLLILCCFPALIATAQTKPRARDLGIPFNGKPGTNNAITDVPGVLVGYKTKITDKKGANGIQHVRTGVTVIMPKGKTDAAYPAGWFCFNGDGEMTGTAVIEEYGMGVGAIGITNTNSVGVVRDAIGAWNIKQFSDGGPFDFSFGLPVVAETFDGMLNDINGLHVTKEDVWQALDSAKSGKIAEGNVGGGTGMALYHFKGGSGTSSRTIRLDSATSYTVGAFVQANFGGRPDLLVAGVPVGKEIKDLMPTINTKPKDGSIIIVIATDAPLLPSFLKMVAKRASIGMGLTGGWGSDGSGDIFIAFSTATPTRNAGGKLQTFTTLSKENLNQVYKATVQATEEAIINALVAAETMKGVNGNTIHAIPHDRLIEIMKKYNRLQAAPTPGP